MRGGAQRPETQASPEGSAKIRQSMADAHALEIGKGNGAMLALAAVFYQGIDPGRKSPAHADECPNSDSDSGGIIATLPAGNGRCPAGWEAGAEETSRQNYRWPDDRSSRAATTLRYPHGKSPRQTGAPARARFLPALRCRSWRRNDRRRW